MTEVIVNDDVAAVRFGFGEWLVIDPAGTVTKEWSVWGDEYSPTAEHEAELKRLEDDLQGAADQEFQVGIDEGYGQGYDEAMSKLYELLSDIPEAVKILDEN